MYNPITKKASHIVAYFLFWLFVAAIKATILHWAQEVSWFNAIIESIVYSLIFGLAGLSIWFVVRFTGLQVRNLWNALINHLAAASLLISLWLYISFSLSALILGQPADIRLAEPADLSWRIGLGAVYYVLIALNYYLLIFYQNYREKEVSELEMKTMLKESELSMLKAQLNPHFIFNSLNSISALTLTRPEDAHEMIVKLSTFLRHTIGQPETELVTIQKEIDTISLYLDIEKSRFGDKLQVVINGLDEMGDQVRLPNLILQPLIENAVKYGVYELLDVSLIKIDLSLDHQILTVKIVNDKAEKAGAMKGKGIGLKNVRKRLQHIYDRSDLIETIIEDSTFSTILTIPQRTNHA
ncbi:MAG: histidine kinase [Bacteroidota bacterium]